MPDLNLRRPHKMALADAATKLQTLVDGFANGDMKAQVSSVTWNAAKTEATAEGPMFTGRFGVSESEAFCEMDLKGIAKSFMVKSMVQGKIEKALASGFPA